MAPVTTLSTPNNCDDETTIPRNTCKERKKICICIYIIETLFLSPLIIVFKRFESLIETYSSKSKMH